MGNCKSCGRKLSKSEGSKYCDNCENYSIDRGFYPNKAKAMKLKFGF